MPSSFGICNQREKTAIAQLNFKRVLNCLATGNRTKFEAGFSLLMRWKLSAVQETEYISQKIVEATADSESPVKLLTALMNRYATIVRFLSIRQDYQDSIYACRCDWLGDPLKKRRRRKRLRKAYVATRESVSKLKLVEDSDFGSQIALKWSSDEIKFVLKANRNFIANDKRLFKCVLQQESPELLSIVLPLLSKTQFKSVEKIASNQLELFIFNLGEQLYCLFENSSLLRRRALEKCKDERFVSVVAGGLSKVNFKRNFIRHRVVDRLLDLTSHQYEENCFAFWALLESLGKLGFDREDVGKFLIECTYRDDPEDVASALCAMGDFKIMGKPFVERTIELFDEFREPNSDLGNKHSALVVFDSHREYIDLAMPVLEKSKSEDVEHFVQLLEGTKSR